MSPVEILENCIREKELELKQLHIGLAALREALSPKSYTPPAQSEPVPAPLPAAVGEITPAVAPSTTVSFPRKDEYTGPRCGACNGKMYQTYRTMPSGTMVSLLKCNDSACGNEAYQ